MVGSEMESYGHFPSFKRKKCSQSHQASKSRIPEVCVCVLVSCALLLQVPEGGSRFPEAETTIKVSITHFIQRE